MNLSKIKLVRLTSFDKSLPIICSHQIISTGHSETAVLVDVMLPTLHAFFQTINHLFIEMISLNEIALCRHPNESLNKQYQLCFCIQFPKEIYDLFCYSAGEIIIIIKL